MIQAARYIGLIGLDQSAFIIGMVGLILGAGGVGSLIPIFRFRADRDTAVATGAEIAVQSLTAALKVSDARVQHLEDENNTLKQTVSQLRLDVTDAQIEVRKLVSDLADTKNKLEVLVREGRKT